MEMICKKCGTAKPEEKFPLNRTNGREYRKTTCNQCDNKARLLRKRSIPYKSEHRKQKQSEAARERRVQPESRPAIIVKDSRSSDKKRGLLNDLDKDWVREQISFGCSYCEETELLMTMDRVDNSRGHTKNNVVPACIRCNYMRKDMPMEAWNFLVPYIKQAKEKGLFGDWDAFGIRKRNGNVGECLKPPVLKTGVPLCTVG